MSKIQSFFETSRNYIISVGNNHHNSAANSVPDAAKHELDITLALAEEIVLGNKFQRISRKQPTSMQLEKSLAVGCWMRTACSHRGFTYVGVDNYTISRFDIDGNQTQNFIQLLNYPITIRAHQDQLFVLVYGNPNQVLVYDLNGNQVKSWNHSDKDGSASGNILCIINNRIITADVTNQRISVYSLDGKTEKDSMSSNAKQHPCLHVCSSRR